MRSGTPACLWALIPSVSCELVIDPTRSTMNVLRLIRISGSERASSCADPWFTGHRQFKNARAVKAAIPGNALRRCSGVQIIGRGQSKTLHSNRWSKQQLKGAQIAETDQWLRSSLTVNKALYFLSLFFALLATSSLYLSPAQRRNTCPTTVNSLVVVSSCRRRSDVRATRVCRASIWPFMTSQLKLLQHDICQVL